MMSANMWLTVFNSLKIVEGGETHPSTADDVKRLMEQINFKLPKGYTEYCQIFGSGVFRNYIRIFCPLSIIKNWDVFEENNLSLEALKSQLADIKELALIGSQPASRHAIELMDRLLKFSFTFGNTVDAGIFLWDLSSYREEDQSYDIYKTSVDDPSDLDDTALVGRDFIRFILDYCLGSKPGEAIPADLLEDEMATGVKEFYRF